MLEFILASSRSHASILAQSAGHGSGNPRPEAQQLDLLERKRHNDRVLATHRLHMLVYVAKTPKLNRPRTNLPGAGRILVISQTVSARVD